MLSQILLADSSSVCGANDTGFVCDGSKSTFRVLFKEPVEIQANTSYIACATLKVSQWHHSSTLQQWCVAYWYQHRRLTTLDIGVSRVGTSGETNCCRKVLSLCCVIVFRCSLTEMKSNFDEFVTLSIDHHLDFF